jgi:hypothetical protein
MTGFTLQETIISGLYLYEARKVLRPGMVFQKQKTNRVIKHLIWVNIFVIFLDAALLATEFANLFSIQTVFKAAVYTIKLKFEFIVLNQLMKIVGAKAGVFSLSGRDPSGPSGGDTSRSHQLATLSGRHRQAPGDTYSAFITPGISTAVDDRKMDGVLRTTEVQIHELSKREEAQLEFETSRRAHGDVHFEDVSVARPRGHRPSMTSSEVEFATKGAYPE